jgi:hypothetical protein
MSSVRFTCTALAGTNKAGILPVDKDGYYTMVVGGLNMFNSAGQWYEYEGAKALFEESSQFMRRVKRGSLRGEVGHPKQELNQNFDSYLSRVLEIKESNVCVHFKEIFLDFNRMKDASGKPVIAIMAKLIPSGPHGPMLQKSLENKSENVCFSIRSFTKDYYNKGVYMRQLNNIITFDHVNEPGISIANKYEAPSLESRTDSVVTRTQVERVVCTKASLVGAESAMMTAGDLFSSLGWNVPKDVKPPFSNW